MQINVLNLKNILYKEENITIYKYKYIISICAINIYFNFIKFYVIC